MKLLVRTIPIKVFYLTGEDAKAARRKEREDPTGGPCFTTEMLGDDGLVWDTPEQFEADYDLTFGRKHQVGDVVHSFDSPFWQEDAIRRSFVLGKIEEVLDKHPNPEHTCGALKIRVFAMFDCEGDRIKYDRAPDFVYPPPNGTDTLMSGKTNGVQLASDCIANGWTKTSRFSEVLDGQMFNVNNPDLGVQPHVRLYEETEDGWNVCEINSGCLGRFSDDEIVEI